MRILITGGGTGGHTSPAVAIIQELQARDPQLAILWAGRGGNIEERICRQMSIPFRAVPAASWPRKGRLRRIGAATVIVLGVVRAYWILLQFRPQLVIVVGGYVSVPVGWAAQRLKIPTILHEQNKRLGLANRLLAPKAARLLLSFPQTDGAELCTQVRLTGNPVRKGFLALSDRQEACAKLGLDAALPVVLVVGGSQGAQSINRAIADLLPHLEADEFQLLWMTGPKSAAEARAAVECTGAKVCVFGFIDDMPAVCAAADLIVSRAGASGTAEIAVMGKPSILIPYPYAAEDHQAENARAFAQAGAAVLIPDGECTGERLLGEIRALLGDRARLGAMGRAALGLARPGAADAIVEEVLAVLF